MEVPGGKQHVVTVFCYEMVGTAILIMAVNLGNGYFTPLAVGMTLYVIIGIFGSVSGGHFNPGVTLSVLIREGFQNFGENIKFALCIWVA